MELKRRQFIKAGLALGAGIALNPSPTLSIGSSTDKPLRIGFVGVGNRGTMLVQDLLKFDGVEIPAICDIDEDNLRHSQQNVKDAGHKWPDGYSRSETDFKRLCEWDDLDLVMTATPWEWHTPICLAAMEAGKPAASEVPIAITEDECWQLVETSERTGKFCTMLENASYLHYTMTVSRMAHQGVFGELLHAMVGYQHDIRPLRFNEKTLEYYNKTGLAHWRIRHHEKYQGNLYPTHALGPAAQWMDINRGDRFAYIVSMETISRDLKDNTWVWNTN